VPTRSSGDRERRGIGRGHARILIRAAAGPAVAD
jgi:hypothetical protein